MSNISYVRNTKKFKKKQLPEIINKYNLIMLPFGKIGKQYIGEGINIIADKRDVRIDILKKDIDFDLSSL